MIMMIISCAVVVVVASSCSVNIARMDPFNDFLLPFVKA